MRHPDYRAGEIVTGWFGWQEFATVDGAAIVRRVLETDLPHSLALGVLGLNGVTALIGLTVIGEPKPGETVLVSTAAGAVGSAVGQIAKLLGCRAIGIAGGETRSRSVWKFSDTMRPSTTRRPVSGTSSTKPAPMV